MRAENSDEGGRDRHRADRAVGLDRAEAELALGALERMPDTEDAVDQIDIHPAQCRRLATPQPKRQSNRVQRVPPVLPDGL
jgi:hypothetical protein